MNGYLDRRRLVAELAGGQHGVVARTHLLALGVSADTIDGWIRRVVLLPLHRGVYALGHASLTQRGRWLAAALACGSSAVLSHGTAAALWGFGHPPTRIHVTVRTWAGLVAPRGVVLHRYRSLADEDLTVEDAIPVTVPERTLLDLAPVLPRRKLHRAIGQADVLRLLDFREVDRLLAAHPRRRGAKAFAAAVAEHRPNLALSRSDFEDRVAELCERHGLPAPVKNMEVAGIEVDLHWPRTDVVVEADSFSFHRTRAAFEKDRRKDAKLMTAGYRVHRFTDRQVAYEPTIVTSAIRASLSSWASQ